MGSGCREGGKSELGINGAKLGVFRWKLGIKQPKLGIFRPKLGIKKSGLNSGVHITREIAFFIHSG
ncbi:hypothetical protein DP120_03630 [Planococcus halotolerans]|uniref:Uncharacterized protein n=1 Tax=Planococcus halotolerans TaxID=2233542 RepID=A0A365L7M9_9BACL|nr:hypothetical protein DP120_03630 [Planococcus halotolerans]